MPLVCEYDVNLGLHGDSIVIYFACLLSSFSVLGGAQQLIIVMSKSSQQATTFHLLT
jgi:hypothetical protein